MDRFWKGIIVGIGGVAPGLSGSVLLIIFGLYQKTLDALGTLLKDFRKKAAFLLPLAAGMVLGVLLFSKVLNYFLNNHEMPTRFCFLGLILGTLPTVWKEVRREGFSKMHLLLILFTALFGTWFFTMGPGGLPQVTDPTLLQSVLLGVAVSATYIIPGVEPAVFLTTLGFYEMYVSALANLDFQILIPMAGGLAVGAMLVSYGMSLLFRRFYTASYSVIFGIFLSMIPNMLNEHCVLGWNRISALSLGLAVMGFAISFFLGDLEANLLRLTQWLNTKRNRKER